MSLLLLFNPSSIPSPTLGNVSTGETVGGNLIINHTIASGADGLLVVSISTQNASDALSEVISVNWNGIALTRAIFSAPTNKDVRAEIWYMVEPAAGTYNVEITTAGSVWQGAVVSNWYGLEPTAQPHTYGSSDGYGPTESVSLTPVSSNTLIIDAISSEAARTSVGGGQTSLATDQGSTDQNVSASYKVFGSTGATTMNNVMGGGSEPWAGVAVAFNATDSFITPPSVITLPATNVTQTMATGNANVTSSGGSTVTRRGFQFNTTEFPDKQSYEDGSFTTGLYDLPIPGLNPSSNELLVPNTTYYFRAFATTPLATVYGEWLSFTTLPTLYNVTIDGIDRTKDVINASITIDDIVNDQQNTCGFRLIDRTGNGIPSNDDEVTITLDSGEKIFGGYIVATSLASKRSGVVEVSIQCVDYARLMDRNLVHRTYEGMTDKAIIEDIVDRYCEGSGITTINVQEIATIDQIAFNYVQPSQALRKIADETSSNWYIDYNKDIHYFPLVTNPAPFNITSASNKYINLKINKNSKQIKNRVYVRGGTKLSDFTTYNEVGDGEKTQFVLPDKPHDVTVEVDRGAGYIEESVGIKNVDTTGYDWYLNYQEKYLEQDSGEIVLGNTDKLRVTYKYDIPILVALENQASIEEFGVHEFLIVDKSITTTESARSRASAELTDYANNLIEGSFETYEPGFVSGQYINISLPAYGINSDYLVQRVSARSFGAGNYKYTVSIASAKTMGIIRFLIELLEDNKNRVEVDNNEVVDELLIYTDQLLSDSLLDSLTIDSAGPYATWCTDSLQSSPSTRAVWDLFQWG